MVFIGVLCSYRGIVNQYIPQIRTVSCYFVCVFPIPDSTWKQNLASDSKPRVRGGGGYLRALFTTAAAPCVRHLVRTERLYYRPNKTKNQKQEYLRHIKAVSPESGNVNQRVRHNILSITCKRLQELGGDLHKRAVPAVASGRLCLFACLVRP